MDTTTTTAEHPAAPSADGDPTPWLGWDPELCARAGQAYLDARRIAADAVRGHYGLPDGPASDATLRLAALVDRDIELVARTVLGALAERVDIVGGGLKDFVDVLAAMEREGVLLPDGTLRADFAARLDAHDR